MLRLPTQALICASALTVQIRAAFQPCQGDSKNTEAFWVRRFALQCLDQVRHGATIFLTSHILEIVERLSTHIGVIAHGKMVAQGRIDELRSGGTGKTLEELFIGLVGGEARTHELDWI